MPFRQLSATTMTGLSADWVSLFDFSQIWMRTLLQPLDVKPFLLFVLLIIMLLAGIILSIGWRQSLEALCGKDSSPERLMVFVIPLVMLPLVAKFRRMIVFAAPSLIPVAAVFMESYAEILRQRAFGKNPDLANRRMKIATTFLAGAWFLFLSVILFESTFRPYLPSNPLRPDRPVVGQLMSFDSYNMRVADFMKRNRINGRVFTSWTASVFVLFNVKDVQVFMDCRDQSIYSDEMITTYFRVLNSRPDELQESMKIVDGFKVDYMILVTSPQDFRLATLFMESRKWGCIYNDEEFLVLARTDSERFGPIFRSGTLDGLWYSDSETRSMSQAVMLLFMNRALPGELLDSLKEYSRRDPNPNLYSLLTLAVNGRSHCLNKEAESFLTSEISRLSSMNYLEPNGARIVRSLSRIAEILEGNAMTCRSADPALAFAALRSKLSHIYQGLEAKYRGY